MRPPWFGQPRRRITSLDALFLLTAGFVASGCDLIGYRPMVPGPSAHLETNGVGLSAHIERLHVEYTSNTPTYRVDVRIQNQLPHEVHIALEKIALALLSSANRFNRPVMTDKGIDLGFLGFNAGHGPRWGVELQFPLEISCVLATLEIRPKSDFTGWLVRFFSRASTALVLLDNWD